VWGRPWAEIFAVDMREEFMPNDFEVCQPNESTARRLQQAIREMTVIAKQVMTDPAIAIEAPWNDWQHRSGLVSRE